MQVTMRVLVAILAAGTLVGSVAAEITSITARVESSLQEFKDGAPGDSSTVSEQFPLTSSELPIRAIAELESAEPQSDPAVALIATQFADPAVATQLNPEEFALNLTLDSMTPRLRYEGTALLEETRETVFLPADAFGRPAGTGITVIGEFFLDGALTLFATAQDANLDGAQIDVSVVVEQVLPQGAPDEVLRAEFALVGNADGSVDVTTNGAVPIDELFLVRRTDAEGLGTLWILAFPDVVLEYTYPAVVEAPQTLRATVRVDAGNRAGDSGLAAVIGAPDERLLDVVAESRSASQAAKLAELVAEERNAPTGVSPRVMRLPPACGLVSGPLLVAMLFVPLAARRVAGRF